MMKEPGGEWEAEIGERYYETASDDADSVIASDEIRPIDNVFCGREIYDYTTIQYIGKENIDGLKVNHYQVMEAAGDRHGKLIEDWERVID